MSDVHHFSRSQLAQMLGVTVPTIGAAIDDGAPGIVQGGSRGKAAKIDSRLFVPWWIERERAKLRAELGGKKLHEVERELDIELKREKLLKERAETLPRSVLANTVRDVMARVAVAINQMPEREADLMIGLRTRADAVEALGLVAEGLRADLRVSDKWMPPEAPRLELTA